jgi:GntR family transcriptional regulator / MocR family aminotransferase
MLLRKLPVKLAARPGDVSVHGDTHLQDHSPHQNSSDGRADVSSFPRAAWLRAIRGALASAPNDLFGYLAGSGVPQLRSAIADYLNRVRGTLAHPDQIVISTGYAQGIALLVGVLAATGAKRLALEDPSSGDDALPAARAAGLEVV